jgi:hypothetical protein
MTALGIVLLVWFGVRAVVQQVGFVVALVVTMVTGLRELPMRWRVWWALGGLLRPGCGAYYCECATCQQAVADWDAVVQAYARK